MVCLVVPPARMTATGVVAGRPPAMRVLHSTSNPGPWCSGASPAGASAPRMTKGASLAAASAQSTSLSPCGRACRTRTSALASVSRGMPPKVGTAVTEETPGATSTSIPASLHVATSSAPRQPKKGSPEYRRTTRRPSRARVTARALMSPPHSAASTTDTSSAQWASSSARNPESSSPAGSRRVMTTSALRSSSAPRRVSRSAPPGPEPTRATWPGRRAARGSSGWALALAFTYWLLVCGSPVPWARPPGR